MTTEPTQNDYRDLASATQRIAELEKQNERLLSLVRLQRSELHQQNAITDKEYCNLLQQSELRVLLETHDDLRAANAELESKLRTQAAEHSLANRRLEDEIGRLRKEVEHQTLHADALELAERGAKRMAYEAQERVKQLEGAIDKIWNILECGMSKVAWRDIALVVNTALSPSPPAVEKKGRPLLTHGWFDDDTPPVKAMYDFKANLSPELRKVFEGYQESLDDAPQTEEKPATVPLAVAEKLAEALEEIKWWTNPVCSTRRSSEAIFKVASNALAVIKK
jgi:hypothetical protein